ncbi:MAG: hypothetical protein V1644_02900 [Candidatus Micrarchaeota archaeon]
MKKTKRKSKVLHTPKLLGFGMFKDEDLVGALMKMRRDERKRGAR